MFFVNALNLITILQDKPEASSSSTSDSDSIAKSSSYLLTRGMAWSISLTLRSTMRDEILKTCFAPDLDEVIENILYRFVFLFIFFVLIYKVDNSYIAFIS